MSRRWFRRKRPDVPPGQIVPPEGVPLNFRIAGVGVRVAAQLADVMITLVAAICLVLLLAVLDITRPSTLIAIASLLFFITRIPYYIFTELAWNGQTIGKKLLKIKVVSHDGGPLTTHALVLRNLMKEAEIFLPGTLLLSLETMSPIGGLAGFAWILMSLLIPLINRHRRRLGDIMAGTHVIHLPVPILLNDLASDAPPPRDEGKEFHFLSHQLDHYGAYELQTLEGLLRVDLQGLSREAAARRRETLAAIIEKIRSKIGYADPVPPTDHQAFLQAFYNAQREHLEQRQLFGERRADKHHSGQNEDV